MSIDNLTAQWEYVYYIALRHSASSQPLSQRHLNTSITKRALCGLPIKHQDLIDSLSPAPTDSSWVGQGKEERELKKRVQAQGTFAHFSDLSPGLLRNEHRNFTFNLRGHVDRGKLREPGQALT